MTVNSTHKNFEEYYKKLGGAKSSSPDSLWSSENDRAYKTECDAVYNSFFLHQAQSVGLNTLKYGSIVAAAATTGPYAPLLAGLLPLTEPLFSEVQSRIDVTLVTDMQKAFSVSIKAVLGQDPQSYQQFCALKPEDRKGFLESKGLNFDTTNPTTRSIVENTIKQAEVDLNSPSFDTSDADSFNASIERCSTFFDQEKEVAEGIANALKDISSDMDSMKSDHERVEEEIHALKESTLEEKKKNEQIKQKIVEDSIKKENLESLKDNLALVGEGLKTTLIAAQTFGIKIPKRVEKGLQAGVLAAQAGIGIASATGGGNPMGYLQAAQSLMGICALFGSQQEDPAEQRHAMIMDAFNQISKQMDAGFTASALNQEKILENQRAMGEFLVNMRLENRRLFNTTFENQAQILRNVQELRKNQNENHALVMRALSIHTQFFIHLSAGQNTLLWDGAHQCKDAIDELFKDPKKHGYLPDQNRFISLQKMREFLTKHKRIGSGLTKIRDNFMGAHDNRASTLYLFEDGQQAAQAVDFNLLIEYVQRNFNQSTAKLIAMLANVSNTAKELDQLAKEKDPKNFSKQIFEIKNRESFNGAPLDLINQLFSIKSLEAWSKVVEKLHFLFELYKDPTNNSLYTEEEFNNLDELNEKGYQMLKRALDFVGLAIVQQNLIAGHLLLPKLSSDLLKKPESIKDILIKHPLIVNNLVIYLFSRTSDDKLVYMTAWTEEEPESLQKILGDHFPIVGEEQNWKIQIDDQEFPLPTAAEIDSGKLAHTLEIEQLLTLHQNLSREAGRYQLAERLRVNGNPALLAIHEGRAKFQTIGG